MPKRMKIYLAILFIAWIILHLSAIFYGTQKIPLHISYIGDEQAPVNGALHILADKNILALRNLKTVYYGPLFSIVALPGIIADFAEKYIVGSIHSAQDYKNFILFNWGGIVWKLRLLSVLFGFLGIYFLAKILNSKTINPTHKQLPIYLGTLLLFFNFHYFEYSSFFKHWAFIVPTLIIQLYFLIKLKESDYQRKYWLWLLTLFFFGFGISYVSALFQIMWLPLFILWIKNKNKKQLKNSGLYLIGIIISVSIVIAWHPYAFQRIIGSVGNNITNTNVDEVTAAQITQGTSLGYYSSIILNNYSSLLILIILLGTYLIKTEEIHKRWWIWSMFSPGIIFFTVFSAISHYEGRYVFPVVVSLIISCSSLFAYYFNYKKTETLYYVNLGLIIFILLFNSIHIFKWIQIYADGPIEQGVISHLLEIQRPNDKTLVVNSYILGHAHTLEAYQAYTKDTNKQDVNLYKEIMSVSLPNNIIPLNAYYISKEDFAKNPEIANKYNHVIIHNTPRVELNQFDYFDENITRLWKYYEYSPNYQFLK